MAYSTLEELKPAFRELFSSLGFLFAYEITKLLECGETMSAVVKHTVVHKIMRL